MSAIFFLSCVFMISLDGARGAILTAFCVDLKWPGIVRGTDVTRGEGSSASGVPGICGKLCLMKNALRPLVAALALASGCAETPTQPAAGTPAPAPTRVPIPTLTSLTIPTPSSVEALFRSIADGDFDAFSRFINDGVQVSTRNKLGETPLYVAAEKDQLEIAKLLIAKGADAKALTPNGETVLHAASMIENSALMAALIEAGADINAANRDGETPLHWAG